MPDVAHWIGPMIPVVLMLSIVVMNHVVTGQRTEKKTADESLRFSAALAAELRAMLELYRTNLALIEQKADYLLSTRTSIVIYKGNLGRLTSLLDTPAIEPVVKAFALNERIEAIVAARSNLKCNLTYQFPVADTKFDDWKQMYEQASQDVEAACRVLERRAGIPVEVQATAEPWHGAVDHMLRLVRDLGDRRLTVERST
jgi:hypothetical protein